MHPVTLVAFLPASHHHHCINFDRHAVGHHGTCVLKLDYGESCKSHPFHVVDADGPNILVLPRCTDLNLVTMIFSITNHEVAARLFYHILHLALVLPELEFNVDVSTCRKRGLGHS